jgi:Na+-transporting NADH:ubiquinone oxidoreductase subunit C
MREKRWFPIFYMFITTAFFSSIVIGFTQLTGEKVKVNERLAFEKAILSVLPGLYREEMNNSELHRTFTEQVTEPDELSAGAYTLRQNGKIAAYALPIEGQGFWAPIKGIIGIEADKKTITAIAFYEQNETPGLGAEIAKPAFREQFKGKVISVGDKPLSIKRPGIELGASDVHAVTGATQTSTRLEKIINSALTNWRQQLNKGNMAK